MKLNSSKCMMVGLALAASAIPGLAQKNTPNVVIIYADDLGFGDVSCNGAASVATPNIDALAETGINFTNAHSPAAVSTPARYGLLTGEYPWRRQGTGILPGNAGMIISPDRYTLPDMFKDKGYATAAIGKWHLGMGEKDHQDWNGTITPSLSDIGFDYSYILPATGDRCPTVFVENGKVDHLDPSDPLFVSYTKNFEGQPTGKDNPELLRVGLTLGHEQSIHNGISRIGFQKGGTAALWRDEDIACVLVEKAEQFIAGSAGQPFFLYFATNDIHVPRMPNERFQGTSSMGPRGDVIHQLDWTVGEIVRILKENGCYENTLLVFSSDNGPVLDNGYADQAEELVGDHRMCGIYRGRKASLLEGGTRVPMIVSWPDVVKGGQHSDALVCHVDFLASFAAVIGQDISDREVADSRDYSRELLGKSHADRRNLVTMSAHPVLVLYSGGYKYIEETHTKAKSVDTERHRTLGVKKEPQLYFLRKDPTEADDLSGKSPRRMRKCQKILEYERSKGFQQPLF